MDSEVCDELYIELNLAANEKLVGNRKLEIVRLTFHLFERPGKSQKSRPSELLIFATSASYILELILHYTSLDKTFIGSHPEPRMHDLYHCIRTLATGNLPFRFLNRRKKIE